MPIDLPGLLAEDELTELVDADIPRVDLVGKGANGIPRFLIAKQDEASAGLLDPEFVRDLIAKADPEPDRREREILPNGITVSGSPADIASFIHKAAERAAGREAYAGGQQAARSLAAGLRADLAALDDAMAQSAAAVAKAELSGKAENDLPDSAFAYIEAGGKKDADGKTTPRSLRHFNISDAAHVRNALARASSSPFGDKAMPGIRAAAKRFKIDVSKEAGVPDTVTKADVNPDMDDGKDGLDPTVPLAEPDEMGSGSPTDPGSPAWESVDAATACKWTSILARARVAVDMLAERELLEAAAGDDGDMCNAMDLQDACCAIDYVIGVLAPFAVAEQSEADCGDMSMAKSAAVLSAPDGTILTAIRKGAEDERLPGALATLETYRAIVRKSGRVLSSVNEQRIRTATASLTEVLSSLPLPVPDDGTSVAKMTPETEADMPKPSTSEDATAASGQEPAMGTAEQPPAAQEAVLVKAGPALQVGLFDHAGRLVCLADPAAIHTDLAAIPVAKADGDKAPMMVVYNQAGDLVGIVSPDDITPVANSTADPDDAPAPEADPAGTPAADDMTPAPAAETGTPAGAVPDDGTVAKQDGTITVTQDVLKSIISEAVTVALGAHAPAQDIAKGDVAGLREKVEALVADIEVLKEQPAAPKVFTNGQVPPAHQLRGQDQGGAAQVDVAKAMDRRREFLAADPADQNRIANGMQQDAIGALAAIHGR